MDIGDKYRYVIPYEVSGQIYTILGFRSDGRVLVSSSLQGIHLTTRNFLNLCEKLDVL